MRAASMGELREGDDARSLASPTLEILMAEISSLKNVVAQRGTSAPELRFFNQTGGWDKLACVHGIADGMKEDSVGNPSSKQALSRVSWLGMGGSRLDELKCERLVQRKRLDLKRVRNKGLPEETRTGEFLHLGNGLELHTSSKKVGVPERMLVLHYLTVLADDWEGIRGSKEGVYAPEHPDFEYFQCMSALILARLEFLNQTLMYLILEEDLSWQVVWRYMMLFVEQYFVRVQFEARSSLDGEMLKAWCDRENRVIRLRVLAAESVKLVVLEKARRLAREFSGSMHAAGRRWRRAVQERRAVRRAVRRGERRAVRRAGAGEVQEIAVSGTTGEGEGPGGGPILANH